MLVAFAASLTPNFDSVLPTFLHQRLAIAGAPDASLLVAFIGRNILRVVVDGTPLKTTLGVADELFPEGHCRWRRGEATDGRYSRHSILRHGMAARAVGDRQGGGSITVSEGRSQRVDISPDIRHGLATSDAVVGIERAREKGGGAGA